MIFTRKPLSSDINRQSFTPLIINSSEYEIMDMTLYELTDLQLSRMDLMATVLNQLQTTFTIYLSIITAYLVTAFVAGKKLTRSQVLIASSLFVVSSLLMTYAMHNSFVEYDRLEDLVRENQILIRSVKGLPPSEAVEDRVAWFLFSGRGLLLSGIFASLYFMWSVRRSNDK